MSDPKRMASRRALLLSAGAAGLALGAGPLVLAPRRARAAESISFVSWGGSYGDFVKEHFIAPFTAETGIEVVYVSGPDLARAKAQVQSGNIEWDVFDSAGFAIAAGSKDGLWEPIDRSIVDTGRLVVPAREDAVPSFIFSGGIAWNTEVTPAPAKTFAELWDTGRFPGRRGLRLRAPETLEMALIADGVAPDALYPLDVDRAFASLDRIKPHVKVWFEQTTQGVTLIQTREVEYTYSYANRIKAAQAAGIPLDFSFDQNINARNYFAVLRGSPRKEAAMRFLEFVTRPDRQTVMAETLGFAPVARGVVDHLSEAARRWLPNLDSPSNVLIDDGYWQAHSAEIDRRFKEWVLV